MKYSFVEALTTQEREQRVRYKSDEINDTEPVDKDI